MNPKNLISECNLVYMQYSNSVGRYLPCLDEQPVPMKAIPFLRWWNNPVLKDRQNRKFCRRELILHVADTDGGAHIDPELDEAYMAISRKNSLGWYFINNDIQSDFQGRPELACMRQIAHELLSTIQSMSKFEQYAECFENN